MDRFKNLARIAVISNVIYLLWLYFNFQLTLPSTLFVILEMCTFFMILLFYYNHRDRSYEMLGGDYNLNTTVDVFITTKNEPLAMVKSTIIKACAIMFANKQIYILDDGNRQDLQKIALTYGCIYLSRPDRDIKSFKAANLNYGLKFSKSEFILVLDADQEVDSTILDHLLGHFKDDKIALITTRQRFKLTEKDFNNDKLFYEYIQAGKNFNGCAISCGSGVIYRRAALDEIGGFQEWNIVEDMYTTYVLNSKGWKSKYITQSYTLGDAPQNMKAINKQRQVWAQDSLRMFIWRNPLFNKGLNLAQKLHYFETGFTYIFSAIVFPGIYVVSFYSLLTNIPILSPDVGLSYLLVRIPSFYFAVKLFDSLDQSSNSPRMWAGMFPVYFKALTKALFYKKPLYKVTSKQTKMQFDLSMIFWQLLFIVLGGGLLFFRLASDGFSNLWIVSMFWYVIMMYWLIPVIARGLAIKNIK